MISRLKNLLEAYHVYYETIFHREAYTAQELAEVEHVKGREHAKATILRTASGLLMAVLPASRQVDVLEVRKLLDDPTVELALESDFEGRFPDCEVGAMPPFGSLYGLEAIVDRSLEKDERIAFPAGTHHESLKILYADFARLVRPRTASFAA
jgi:Ala-tRNA(Pro) deacylase